MLNNNNNNNKKVNPIVAELVVISKGLNISLFYYAILYCSAKKY